MNEILQKFSQYQFNTRVNIAKGDVFDIANFNVIKEINSEKKFFSKHPIVIVADPFLYVRNGELFLFYEEQEGLFGLGVIKMIKTGDLLSWSEPVIVLQEEFHLSYPNVFQIGEQIYMMPETGQDNSIKLYKPNEDLTEWKLYKTIFVGSNFVDSSIIFHDDHYYLFTTDYTDRTNILKIFYSKSINDEWKEHPKSPISNDPNRGRCAGSLFNYKDNIYRPVQRCGIRYGGGVDIYQVQTLSVTDYREVKYYNLIPNSEKFYKTGGHHFNICEFKGNQVVATDGIEDRLNFFEIIRRVKGKLRQQQFYKNE
ncbi:hypothetical protein [Oceanihabitans sediminis]|uniref:glucosamine inositolphosphorylceramide transferase family protein n=1 Tax=Oceanihabitans sediminis TaxID=1812012 RepID=UPI003A902DCF